MSVRFAPSPTGRFHIGNLRTAWVSHALAKHYQMKWVVRFEDIDKPRVVPGAMEQQLADMQTLGLKPDQIILQSSHIARHWQVFGDFYRQGLIYPCFCSRKQIRDALRSSASAPHEGEIPYNGACRHLKNIPSHDLPSLAWRFKMPAENGEQDFIIGRTLKMISVDDLNGPEGFRVHEYTPGYQWACAIDDFDGGHDILVRAWDLESALIPQRSVQSALAALENKPFKPPAVFYCALVIKNDGYRLQKRTLGVGLSEILAGGITSENIIEKFRKSLEAFPTEFDIGQVFGENQRNLKLESLGLKPH